MVSSPFSLLMNGFRLCEGYNAKDAGKFYQMPKVQSMTALKREMGFSYDRNGMGSAADQPRNQPDHKHQQPQEGIQRLDLRPLVLKLEDWRLAAQLVKRTAKPGEDGAADQTANMAPVIDPRYRKPNHQVHYCYLDNLAQGG